MKTKFVYQSKLDGKIYGDAHEWTPQQAGKINAQNRRDGTYGVWLRADYLTKKELANRGERRRHEETLQFPLPCVRIGANVMKIRQRHICKEIKGAGWFRWRCVRCDRAFRRHPYAATCPGTGHAHLKVSR